VEIAQRLKTVEKHRQNRRIQKRILQIRQMRSRQHWKTEHIQQNFRRTVLCSM